MRSFKIHSLILLILLLAGLAAPAAAQDSPVKVIPVPGMMFGSVLSPDGRWLVMFENGPIHNDVVEPLFLSLRVLDVATGELRLLSGHTDYATDAAFSPDGSTLASYHANGYIYLWDVASGEMIKTLPAIPGSARLLYHPDGKSLIVQIGNSFLTQIMVWDTETGHITAIHMPRTATWPETRDRKAPFDTATQIALSPDGTQVAVATMYNNIQLLNLADGTFTTLVASTDELPRLDIRQLAFTPDGTRLIYHHWGEGIIYSLDLASGEKSVLVEIATKTLFALSPDGSRLVWVNGEENSFSFAALDQAVTPTVIPSLVDSGGEYELRIIPRVSYLAVTPDGQQAIFSGFYADDGLSNAVLVITLS